MGCCLCIPIETGMKIMAYLSMLEAILVILMGVMTLFSPLWYIGIVVFVVALLPIFVALQWYKWLKDDNADTTANVVKWMRILFFISAIFNALSLLNIFNSQVTAVQSPISIIINALIGIFFAWYFYNVTRRSRLEVLNDCQLALSQLK